MLLNNGGMFRGTISERVPNEYVLLITATGEQRKFSMDEVNYAGPAAGMPTSPPAAPTNPPSSPVGAPNSSDKVKPFATIHGQEARLQLEASEPGITFHRRSGSATAGNIVATGFDDLCSAPCEVSIPAGSHVLALSKGTDKPIASEDAVTVPPGRSIVRGTIDSNAGIRAAGWVVGAVGIGVGAYLVFTSSEEKEECDELGCTQTYEINDAKLYGGSALVVGGALLGWVMIGTGDKASFTVAPGSPAGSLRSPRLDASRFLNLGGLTATGRF